MTVRTWLEGIVRVLYLFLVKGIFNLTEIVKDPIRLVTHFCSVCGAAGISYILWCSLNWCVLSCRALTWSCALVSRAELVMRSCDMRSSMKRDTLAAPSCRAL